MAVSGSANNVAHVADDGENPDDIYVEIQPGGALAGSISRNYDRTHNGGGSAASGGGINNIGVLAGGNAE